MLSHLINHTTGLGSFLQSLVDKVRMGQMLVKVETVLAVVTRLTLWGRGDVALRVIFFRNLKEKRMK